MNSPVVAADKPYGVASSEGRSIKIRRFAIVLTLIAFFLQPFISFTGKNILAAFCACGASLITFCYLFGRKTIFERYPLSAITLVGLNISTQSGALLYQSFTWTPLEFNLFDPVKTFLCLGSWQIVLVLAHFFYVTTKGCFGLRNSISRGLVARIGLFKRPATVGFWVMGLLGTASIWFRATSLSDMEYGDVAGRFFTAMRPLACAPFLIPFLPSLSSQEPSRKGSFGWLVVYSFLLVVVALAKNSRSVFATGFITFGLIFFIYYIKGFAKPLGRRTARIIFLCVPAIVFLNIFSDLATSMVMVRNQRKDVVGVELIKLTFATFQDRRAVAEFKDSKKNSVILDYNETYISNPIFARLITTKFHDNTIYYAGFLNQNQTDSVRRTSESKIVALLPTPLIKLFGLDIEKKGLEFSMGDYIYYLVSGRGLGGYRTGSPVAHGLVLFGALFYVIMFFVALVAYSIVDSFFFETGSKTIFSPLILILIYNLFSLFNGDSAVDLFSFFLRTLPQNILFYILLVNLFFGILFPAPKSRHYDTGLLKREV